jgi:hypothetical protein
LHLEREEQRVFFLVCHRVKLLPLLLPLLSLLLLPVFLLLFYH